MDASLLERLCTMLYFEIATKYILIQACSQLFTYCKFDRGCDAMMMCCCGGRLAGRMLAVAWCNSAVMSGSGAADRGTTIISRDDNEMG
jgi:hypothetical protein